MPAPGPPARVAESKGHIQKGKRQPASSAATASAPQHRVWKADTPAPAKPQPTTGKPQPVANLLVQQRGKEIVDAVLSHSVTVLQADTGSGKSSQVAAIIARALEEIACSDAPDVKLVRPAADSGSGKASKGAAAKATSSGRCGIVITQPRRLAAKALAEFVASQWGCKVGEAVGYVAGSDKKPGSLITYMTDRQLVQECIEDPSLSRYRVVILDEAHERRIDVDLLCGKLKAVLVAEGVRDDGSPHNLQHKGLRLVVTSATLELDRFSGHFGDNSTATESTGSATTGNNSAGLESGGSVAGDTSAAAEEASTDVDAAGAGTSRFKASAAAFVPGSATLSSPAPLMATPSLRVAQLTIPGRMYPVEVIYEPQEGQSLFAGAVAKALDIHVTALAGHILVFLPEIAQVEKAVALFQQAAATAAAAAKRPAYSFGAFAKPVAASAPRSSAGVAAAASATGGNDSEDEAVAAGGIEDETSAETTVVPSAFLALPLHGSLEAEEQQKVLEPVFAAHTRKVIFSTVVAETSITIDGLRYVVCCGRGKEPRYDPRRGVTQLDVGPITQSSAKQRAGRAGRTGPGKCYRLYSEEEFNLLQAHRVPEMQRTSPDSAALKLLALGVADPLGFHYIDPPSEAALKRSLATLHSLGACRPSPSLSGQWSITDTGTVMASLQCEPRIARILLHAVSSGRGAFNDAVVTAAYLANRQYLFRRLAKPKDAAAAPKAATPALPAVSVRRGGAVDGDDDDDEDDEEEAPLDVIDARRMELIDPYSDLTTVSQAYSQWRSKFTHGPPASRLKQAGEWREKYGIRSRCMFGMQQAEEDLKSALHHCLKRGGLHHKSTIKQAMEAALFEEPRGSAKGKHKTDGKDKGSAEGKGKSQVPGGAAKVVAGAPSAAATTEMAGGDDRASTAASEASADTEAASKEAVLAAVLAGIGDQLAVCNGPREAGYTLIPSGEIAYLHHGSALTDLPEDRRQDHVVVYAAITRSQRTQLHDCVALPIETYARLAPPATLAAIGGVEALRASIAQRYTIGCISPLLMQRLCGQHNARLLALQEEAKVALKPVPEASLLEVWVSPDRAEQALAIMQAEVARARALMARKVMPAPVNGVGNSHGWRYVISSGGQITEVLGAHQTLLIHVTGVPPGWSLLDAERGMEALIRRHFDAGPLAAAAAGAGRGLHPPVDPCRAAALAAPDVAAAAAAERDVTPFLPVDVSLITDQSGLEARCAVSFQSFDAAEQAVQAIDGVLIDGHPTPLTAKLALVAATGAAARPVAPPATAVAGAGGGAATTVEPVDDAGDPNSRVVIVALSSYSLSSLHECSSILEDMLGDLIPVPMSVWGYSEAPQYGSMPELRGCKYLREWNDNSNPDCHDEYVLVDDYGMPSSRVVYAVSGLSCRSLVKVRSAKVLKRVIHHAILAPTSGQAAAVVEALGKHLRHSDRLKRFVADGVSVVVRHGYSSTTVLPGYVYNGQRFNFEETSYTDHYGDDAYLHSHLTYATGQQRPSSTSYKHRYTPLSEQRVVRADLTLCAPTLAMLSSAQQELRSVLSGIPFPFLSVEAERIASTPMGQAFMHNVHLVAAGGVVWQDRKRGGLLLYGEAEQVDALARRLYGFMAAAAEGGEEGVKAYIRSIAGTSLSAHGHRRAVRFDAEDIIARNLASTAAAAGGAARIIGSYRVLERQIPAEPVVLQSFFSEEGKLAGVAKRFGLESLQLVPGRKAPGGYRLLHVAGNQAAIDALQAYMAELVRESCCRAGAGAGKTSAGDASPPDCQVCLDSIEPHSAGTLLLATCGHWVHRDCLANTALSEEHRGRPVVCPYCPEEGGTECAVPLCAQDIRSLFRSNADAESFIRRAAESFVQRNNARWAFCPAGAMVCGMVYERLPDTHPYPGQACEGCGRAHCRSCGLAVHPYGRSCAQHRALAAAGGATLGSNSTFRVCPHCGVTATKISGCNHMACDCKNHWCWLCEEKMDPKDPYSHYRIPGTRCYQKMSSLA